MKNFKYFIFLFVIFSCYKKADISNKELNILLNKNISIYFEKKEITYLKLAYNKLKNNKDFREKGLSGENTMPIISVMLNLKKYVELEKLLTDNKTLNESTKLNLLNSLRYFKHKDKNPLIAKFYINENLKLINKSIHKNPTDSLKYVEYFSTKILLIGKKETLKEIDKMKNINKKFSPLFYDSILKDAILDIPDEYLIK